MERPWNFLFTALFFAATASGSTCYSPDGSVQDFGQPAFVPCNQVVGVVSMCCGTNWTGGKVAKDICQPNGLCLNSDNGEPLYWRSSCTDPTWKSPLCLKNLCTTYEEGGDPTQNVAVTECVDGSWCCQGGNTTCCDEGLGLKIAATIGASQSSSTDVSKPSTSTPSITSPSPSSQPPATSPPTAIATAHKGNEKLSTASKVGIAIAATIAGMAIAVTGMLLWRNRRRALEAPVPKHGDVGMHGGAPNMRPVEADSGERRQTLHEMMGTSSERRATLHEMMGTASEKRATLHEMG